MERCLLVIVCLLGILGGCVNEQDTNQTNEINQLKAQIDQLSLEKQQLENTLEEERLAFEQALNEQVNNDYGLIQAKEIEEYPHTLFKKVSLDIDKDGTDEEIELHVNVGKSDDGLYAWDDGQNWLLVVKDDDKTYPLFDNYVQLGSIDFTIAIYDSMPAILLLKAQHGDRVVQKFTYVQNEDGYQKETFYKKENINNHYNEAAAYAFFNDALQIMDDAFTTKMVTLMEASGEVLQDMQQRMNMTQPILMDLYQAQRLLDLVSELQPVLRVSLTEVMTLLEDMTSNVPTAEQINELTTIHNSFKELQLSDDLSKEDKQLHSEGVEILQKLEFMNNGD